MRIVELSDYSMVIMKDSQDPPWYGVGDVYRQANSGNKTIAVERLLGEDPDFNAFGQTSEEYVYTAGRLVLFFSDPVDSQFKLHDRVYLRILSTRRSRRNK